jgi:hypothetical protein
MRSPMIRSHADHAADERTFLAWIRTGLSALRWALSSIAVRSCLSHPRSRSQIENEAGRHVAPVLGEASGDHLHKVADFTREHLACPLTLEILAREAGVSRFCLLRPCPSFPRRGSRSIPP